MTDADLITRLDALLPQTQCRQCGYAGCLPYAKAMAAGKAGPSQCAPGGENGARELAAVLGLPYAPIDPRYGSTKPPLVALIDEMQCIGCTLCIKACPVDAIVGASQYMHTVITQACTGCELCLQPCPVDCIAMIPVAEKNTDERRAAAQRAKKHFEAREARLLRDRAEAEKNAVTRAAATRKRQAIERAIARANIRIAKKTPAG